MKRKRNFVKPERDAMKIVAGLCNVGGVRVRALRNAFTVPVGVRTAVTWGSIRRAVYPYPPDPGPPSGS